MTCIVGLVEKGVVYMGGDSCGSDGWGSETFAGPKVFKVGPFVIGYTSSFRMGQILQGALTLWRPWAEVEDIGTYMRSTFIDSVRQAFKTGGWAEKHDDREEGGEFLVGALGRLFYVQGDYAVLEPTANYSSCGSGFLTAKGALAALESVKSTLAPVKRVRVALEAAERHVAGVKGPFTVLQT